MNMLSIGQVARRTGVGVETVRYYMYRVFPMCRTSPVTS